MKKIILSLFALAAMGLSANAQQVVKFGPKAGVNLSNLSGGDADGLDMKVGFHIGAFAEIFFTDQFAVQPELLYSTQGAKGEILGGDFEAKYDFINIPIMAKYYFTEGLAIEAGPYVGFLMKAEDELSGGPASFSGDVKDERKSIDFGLGFGASYSLDNGFFAGARYSLGLSKLGEENDSSEPISVGLGEDIKNSVIQISVGYKF